MKHSFKEWFTATRYWSFPVSTMPVIVTFAFLLSQGMIPEGVRPIITFLLSLAGVVVLHSAGNVLSDYFDYKTGVDNPEAFAVPNLVFKKFEPSEYLKFSIILFIAGIVIGIVITLLSGWTLLIIGGLGVSLTAAYSFLKYNALGDLDIFIIFSCLIMLGTGCAVTGELLFEPLILALPVGIITVSVLHANNTIDIESDCKAGMKSFAMMLGAKNSVRLYQIYMLIPFAAIVITVALGLVSPFALLCLPAAIPAAKNFKAASAYYKKGLTVLHGLDQASAKLQLVFSGLLSIGLFIDAMI